MESSALQEKMQKKLQELILFMMFMKNCNARQRIKNLIMW